VLREAGRTLRPGGACLFTVPTYKGKVTSERRAHYRPDGGVDHPAGPEYRGNPVSDAGSLVTFHYRYDFAELIAAWSGPDVEVASTTTATGDRRLPRSLRRHPPRLSAGPAVRSRLRP
jgi:hypothetical protein